jgi:hypothetical protein
MEAETMLQAEIQDALSGMSPDQLETLAGREPTPVAPTRYAQYQEPGGDNYGEILITLPPRDPDGTDLGIANYRSSHWSEPNVLAHARYNERLADNGATVLFVEEIQSDWHQAGRERGYVPRRDPRAVRQTEAEIEAAQRALMDTDFSLASPGDLRDLDTAVGRAQVRNLAARMGRDVDEAGAAWDRTVAAREADSFARGFAEAAKADRDEALARAASESPEFMAIRSAADEAAKAADRDAAAVWAIEQRIQRRQGGDDVTGMMRELRAARDAAGESALRYAEMAAQVRDMHRQFALEHPAVIRAQEALTDARARADAAAAELDAAHQALGALQAHPEGVPDAPFKTTWPMLAFKRLLAHAVERGVAQISWATGQMQANRYGQGMSAGAVVWNQEAGTVEMPGTGAAPLRATSAADLRRVVGPDLAERLLAAPVEGNGTRTVLGSQHASIARPDEQVAGRPIRAGGKATGQAYFYDARLAQDVERLVKPLGGRLGSVRVNTAQPGSPPRWETVYSVAVTPQMREAVASGGLPLFSAREGGGLPPERAAEVRRVLDGPVVAEIPADQFPPDGRRLSDKVVEWLRGRGLDRVEVPGVGEVRVDERAVKDSIAHGVGRIKAMAFAAVPDVLQRGLLVDTVPFRDGPAGSTMSMFAAPIAIGGAPYVAMVLVRSDANARRMYVHEVVLRERLQSGAFETGAGAAGKAGAEQPPGAPTGAMRQVLRSVYGGNDKPAAEDPPPEPRAFGGLVGTPGLASGGLAAPDARDARLPQGDMPAPEVVSGLGVPPTIGGGTPDPETRGALQGLEMWRAAAALV